MHNDQPELWEEKTKPFNSPTKTESPELWLLGDCDHTWLVSKLGLGRYPSCSPNPLQKSKAP